MQGGYGLIIKAMSVELNPEDPLADLEGGQMEGSETPSNLVSWVLATLVVSHSDPQPKLWSQTAWVQIQTEAF